MRLKVQRRRRRITIRLEIGDVILTVEISNTKRSLLLKTATSLLYN
jgi:hypothetical protein